MKAQFIYSVAALATFPIVVNAQVNAESIGKITAAKDGTAWTKDIALVPGKYTFKSGVSVGTAGKKATVSILDGATPIVPDFQVTVGDPISKDFVVSTNKTVTIKVVSETAAADFVADESVVQLNFNFSKVAELLQIEYNKVTQILGQAQYADKVADAQTCSALYDRVMAIANADYTYYKNETEGLKALYAGDQTDVTGLSLYTEIQSAINTVKTNELAYLDGDNALGGLNTRYNNLANNYAINYVTSALSGAKTAAKNARNAFNSEPTAANLIDAKAKIAAYKLEIETVEGIKTDNEDANTYLVQELEKVYGGATSYYLTSLEQIAAQYAPLTRFADLKGEVEAALSAIVGGSDYTDVQTSIHNKYIAKESKEKKNDLINEIAAFKEKLTRKVSDFKALRDRLAEVYDIYDAQESAANTLTTGAEDFLLSYKSDVDNAVGAFLTFIVNNDKEATIANLTETEINAKIADITSAKTTYSAKKAIFDDWKALQDEVDDQNASLNTTKDDIDTYAKVTKGVDDAVFKPTTIWGSTITSLNGLGGLIPTLLSNVNSNKLDASNYKNSDAYKNALAAIKTAIANLKTNANAATDIYAAVDAKIKAAQTLRAALLDPTVEPLKDLTTLNVWTNQVTIDDAVKDRTPYKKFIKDTDGTITVAISNKKSDLDAAPSKTAPLNAAGTNVDNVLGYLKSIAPTPANVLKGELETMEAIKANYNADEEKFMQQLDQQECAGLVTMINDKAVVFEASIEILQGKVNAVPPIMSNANVAKLQNEINGIIGKINDAKAVAAKAGATKDELTAAYNSIKDLATTDIATAQTNASNYEDSFTTSTGFYTTLNGTAADASTKPTLFGLTKKVTEQKGYIGGLAKLTDAQKNTLKGKVDAVEVVKQEGTPAVDVTYNLTKIANDIRDAWQNETLNDSEVSRYQGIINDLKAKTEDVKTQADYLNDLETQLAAIDFNAAKAAILAKDDNADGFFVKKLLGTSVAGECQFDFNKIKADIEAEEVITSGEKTTYEGKINDLNTVIAGLPGKALANKTAYDNAKNYYDHETAPLGAKQKYEEYVAKLNAERQTTVLPGQLNTLAILYDAMVEKFTVAGQHYDAGTAGTILPTDVANITSAFNDIKAKYDEYYNEVNYNAQIAADNKAIYDAITAAAEDAAAAYATSSTIINTYKNFKSNELQAAAESAQTELKALYDYLFAYDAKVLDIQTRADKAYNGTVSPAKFDTEESYKAEFVAVKDQINLLTQALVDKIKGIVATTVTNKVNSYGMAIEISKAKVKKFSATDADVADAIVDGWFAGIDDMLDAINVVKDDDTKIKDLDTALKNASASGSGIEAQITSVEQTQATAALTTIIGAISTTYQSQWAQADLNDYNTIAYNINNRPARCVNNFASYKDTLNRIKGNAEQIALDNAAIAGATGAITTANNELNELIGDYQDCAAGAQVKATVDQIKADLDAHPASGVTVANSAAEKSAAEAISARIVGAYNDLYDAEVTVIEGLITTAKQENLTYSGADKATISAEITAQEGYLSAAKEAVAKPDTDPAHKTKYEALKTITHNLKTIEAALNGYIKTMTDGNATNINDAVVNELVDLVDDQNNRAYWALKVLNVNTSSYRYRDVYGSWNYYSAPAALTTEQSNIQTSINDLYTYIYSHQNEITAYRANVEAMLEDIKTAITNLETKAQQEYDRQNNQFVQADQFAVENAWNTAEGYITTAQGNIGYMNDQLGYYGSASKYANKVKKLDDQIAAATDIFTTAQTEAESLTSLRDKYNKAITAGTNITNALNGVAANSTDIINMAKAAHINAFIDNLRSQVIANTWTNSSNYTTTDKGILDGKWNAIRDYVGYVVNDVETKGTLKTNAEGYNQAEIIYHPTYGYETSAGVLATLERGETTFNDMLSELKQLLKDMSLEEDVKGHISGNDDISIDDLEDLADIILNAQEESADMERCDISGDGTVDVTDLVWLRYFLVHGDWPNSAATARGDMASANDYINMEVVSVENNVTRIAINLDNETVFNHFQLNVQLPEGAKVVGQTLGERVEGANLMMAQNGTTVRMLAISTANNVFAGNEGAVVYIDIEGLNGEVNIEKAIFTDTELNGHLLTANSTTSIRESITNALQAAGQKIYNMGGKMMNGLKKGVNIIRNADGSTKKVMK